MNDNQNPDDCANDDDDDDGDDNQLLMKTHSTLNQITPAYPGCF